MNPDRRPERNFLVFNKDALRQRVSNLLSPSGLKTAGIFLGIAGPSLAAVSAFDSVHIPTASAQPTNGHEYFLPSGMPSAEEFRSKLALDGDPADWEIKGGHFFTQTGGGNNKGFFVPSDFYDALNNYGGVKVAGYPIGHVFEVRGYGEGFHYLPTQNFIIQKNPFTGQFFLANIMDWAHEIGLDPALKFTGVPEHFAGNDGSNGDFEKAKQIRLDWLREDPTIEAAYHGQSQDPVTTLGVPTSKITDMGPFFAVRTQRSQIIRWKTNNLVQFASVPDVFKSMGKLIPAAATIPTTQDNIPAKPITPEPTIQPKPTPAPTPQPTPEIITGNYPETPKPAHIRGDWDTTNRDIFLRDIKWHKTEKQNGDLRYIIYQGKLLGYRLEGNNLIISMDTDKGAGGETDIVMSIDSSQAFGVIALRGASASIIYRTSSISDAYGAMNYYFRLEDPIAASEVLNGSVPEGIPFRVVTWR